MEKVYVTAEIKRYSDGTEEIREYDNKGNLTYRKDSDGYEEWFDYDDKGHVIRYENSDG